MATKKNKWDSLDQGRKIKFSSPILNNPPDVFETKIKRHYIWPIFQIPTPGRNWIAVLTEN